MVKGPGPPPPAPPPPPFLSRLVPPPPPPPPPIPGIKTTLIPGKEEQLPVVRHSGKIGKTGVPFLHSEVRSQQLYLRPKIKLKAMHWEKLDAQNSQYTIWSHMMLDANELASVLKNRGLLDEIERVFQHKESKLRFGVKAEKSGKKELMGNDLRQKFGIACSVLWLIGKGLRCIRIKLSLLWKSLLKCYIVKLKSLRARL
jgi:cytokinesis protein